MGEIIYWGSRGKRGPPPVVLTLLGPLGGMLESPEHGAGVVPYFGRRRCGRFFITPRCFGRPVIGVFPPGGVFHTG